VPTLESALPRPELRPYVRAYAQRRILTTDVCAFASVPAQLEQILNFELGVKPGVRHHEMEVSDPVWIGGAQTSFPGFMELYPQVESFAIFFYPTGWSQLFSIPVREITNRVYDAPLIMGPQVRILWNRLGEASSFQHRVKIVEEYLLSYVGTKAPDRVAMAVRYLFRRHGAVRIPELARMDSIGLRQFERIFRAETGMSPKIFARVARFQAAVDAKLSSPARSWLDIAHSFDYHDQMHMIHDFERLGKNTPSQLLAQMGDVRPPALTSADPHH
jgi:AraC-like DNA-binding protein